MSTIVFRMEDPDEGVLVELHDASGKIRDLSVNADNTIDETENATEIRVSPAPGFTIDTFTDPDSVYNSDNYRYVRLSFTDEGGYWSADVSSSSVYFDATFTATAATSGAPVSDPVLPLTVVGDAAVVTAELYGDAGSLIRVLDLNTPLTIDEPTPNEIRVSVADGWLLDAFTVTPEKIYSQEDMRFYSLSFSSQGEYYAATVESGLYADREFEVQINVLEEPGALISPFNRIYYLTPEDMEKLAMSVPEFVQDQNYIINLIKMPFKIPDEVKQSPAMVEIGPIKLTDIEAPPLDTDVIEFDLGEIDVGELQGSSMDYQGYEFELVVPYSDTRVELDPSYVVGRVLLPVMSVDMYRGDAVINVFAVGVDEPVATTTLKLGREIPIHLGEDMWTSLSTFKGDGNGVPYAYLEVSRSVLTSSRTRVEGVIQGSVGYVEVESVDLVGVLDSEEVRQALQSGVIIREP